MAFEAKLLLSIMVLIGFLAFMMSIVPPELQFINIFDFTWFIGGLLAVTGACVLATGIPCAGAIVIFGATSIYTYVILYNSVVKLIIFLPIMVTLVYITMRLARGGG
jgi:hypothetical protein